MDWETDLLKSRALAYADDARAKGEAAKIARYDRYSALMRTCPRCHIEDGIESGILADREMEPTAYYCQRCDFRIDRPPV